MGGAVRGEPWLLRLRSRLLRADSIGWPLAPYCKDGYDGVATGLGRSGEVPAGELIVESCEVSGLKVTVR